MLPVHPPPKKKSWGGVIIINLVVLAPMITTLPTQSHFITKLEKKERCNAQQLIGLLRQFGAPGDRI